MVYRHRVGVADETTSAGPGSTIPVEPGPSGVTRPDRGSGRRDQRTAERPDGRSRIRQSPTLDRQVRT